MSPRPLWQVLFVVPFPQLLVAQTASSVSIFSSPNPATYGEAVSITAAVNPSIATGRVTFYDGAAVLGDSAVSGGQAIFTTRLLNTGARTLRAHYSGDSAYAASDSAVLPQTVSSVAAESFPATATYALSPGPGAVVAGDFNQDGKTDLAVFSGLGQLLYIFLGNRDGTFQQAATYQTSPSSSSAAAGDMNNDGIPDLVVSSGGRVTVWIGKGDGSFTQEQSYASFVGSPVQLGDFNGDGNVDAVTWNGNFDLQVWWGNGDGTLTAGPVLKLAENGSPQFVVGDFNADGKADIASMGYSPDSNSFVVFLGSGDGTFIPVNQSGNASLADFALAAGDLKNDGKLDLVLSNGGGSFGVLIGNGDGTFQPVVQQNAGPETNVSAIADFNGDGKPDLAVVDSAGDISILAGNGDGTFQPATAHFATGGSTAGIALGDFNGDGRVDLAVSVIPTVGAELSILLGQAAAPPTVQAVSVSPASGTGASQSFTFQFSDSAGAADIANMSVMFGSSSSSYACVVTYTRANNGLSLVPSGVTSSTGMANEDCTIQLPPSGPSEPAGTMQSLNLAVSFNGTIKGTQTVSGLVTSASGVTTGWQTLGTWTVPATTLGPAMAVSVAPASGTGMTQTFLFTYVDPSGPGDLASVSAAFGNPAGPGSCDVQVTPDNNEASLSQGDGYFGVGPGALGSQGTLQTSQCTLNLANSSAVWSGNTLAVALSLTFSSSYSGPQIISAEAFGFSVIGPGWRTVGTWTVGPAPMPGPFLISTIAGHALPPTPLPGNSALFHEPSTAAIDANRNLYFIDTNFDSVFRLDASGVVTRVAGNGSFGYSGDGGAAVDAELNGPSGVAVDASGNVYINDSGNAVIRVVSQSGSIATYSPSVLSAWGLALDPSGYFYISDGGARILRLGPGGTVTTFAGNGTSGYSGDGGPATNAQLNNCFSFALDADGDLFLADTLNNVVRKVSVSGTITTVAGGGTAGDGGPATNAALYDPQGVAVDSRGNLYISDSGYDRVREVTVDGTIHTVAGSGVYGFQGDESPASLAALSSPGALQADSAGNLYISDVGNNRIREVSGGIISTVVGGGSGDFVAAPFDLFNALHAVARDDFGNLYVSEPGRVQVVTPSGAISTVAGNGVAGYYGDNGPATAAQISGAPGLAVGPTGALYIADPGNNRVRRIAGGIITTVAGTGSEGYNGDGGPAAAAQLYGPAAVTTDPSGDLFISDAWNNVVRKVAPNGIISTVAGVAGYTGNSCADFGPATAAHLSAPAGLAVDSAGNIYIADSGDNCVRMVDTKGIVSTVAGTGFFGYIEDGGPATEAELFQPTGVAVDSAGNLYIADSADSRIRMVTTDGIIHTIAGGGTEQLGAGDGAPAVSAWIMPNGIALDAAADIYMVDWNYLRVLTPQGAAPVLAVFSTHTGNFPPGSAGQYTVTVSNAPLAGPTSGTVTVTEYLPAGLLLSSMSGQGWNCSANSCTRSDTLGAGLSYPPISVDVSVSSTSTQVMNQVVVSGGGSFAAGAQDLTLTLSATPVTIQTDPPGLQFSVNALAPQNAPATLELFPGQYAVAVTSVQAGAPGTQYVFTGWSDGGAASHTVDVTGTAAIYTATFKTQYQLTSGVFPVGAGTVNVASGTFFDAGTTVGITATPGSSYALVSWGGADLGTSNPASITMNSPLSITADFGPPGFTCAVTGDATAGVADLQAIIAQALGIAAAQNDLNGDGVVNIADVQKVMEAALKVGCLY